MADMGKSVAPEQDGENQNATAEGKMGKTSGSAKQEEGGRQIIKQGIVTQVNSDTEYRLSPEECQTCQRHMSTLIEVCGGMIEAGLAVNGAIVRVAKRFGQMKLFISPPKVLGFRFTRGFELLVSHCDQKELCLGEIYNLSLRHINYCPLQLYMDMRVAMIKEMIQTIKSVFEESWNDGHTETWTKLLDWLTWNIIDNYASSGMKAISLRDSWVHIRVLKEEDDSGGFGDALIFQLSVVAQEIFGLVVTERAALGKIFNKTFETLVLSMGDPQKFTEEFFVLSSRHGRYGVQEHLFPLFQQSIMVTLRSLIPQVWNDTLEDAWSWFYLFCQDNMVRNFRDITTHAGYIEATKEVVLDLDAAQLGADIHVKFLNVYPAAASLFQKTLRMLITTKIMGTLMAVIQDPTGTLEDVRAVGVRHTKFGISERYLLPFGAMLWEIVAGMLPGMWTEKHSSAWSFYLDFIANVMTRAIDTGTTLADNAFLKNSVELCMDAVSQAPRCARAWWLLAAPVSGQTVSYFLWALQDMKFKLAECILEEVLTFRADCLKYYCGKDELFVAHPDLVQLLCDTNAIMLLRLFDGLMWESQKIRGKKKRVNYYLKQVYGDPSEPRWEDAQKTALASLCRLGNLEVIRHPFVLTLMEVQWTTFGKKTFTMYMMPEVITLMLFMAGFVVLDRHHYLTYGFMQGRDMATFGLRVASLVVAVVGIFLSTQCVAIYEDRRLGRTQTVSFYISRKFRAASNAVFGKSVAAGSDKADTEKEGNDENETEKDSEASTSGSEESGSASESGASDQDDKKKKKKTGNHAHGHRRSKKKGVTYKELLGQKSLQELLGSNLARTEDVADDADFSLCVPDFFTHGSNLLKLLMVFLLCLLLVFDQESGVLPAADPHRREYQNILISFVGVMLWIGRLELCEFSMEMLKLRQTVQFSLLHVALTTVCIVLATFMFAGAITLAEPLGGYLTAADQAKLDAKNAYLGMQVKKNNIREAACMGTDFMYEVAGLLGWDGNRRRTDYFGDPNRKDSRGTRGTYDTDCDCLHRIIADGHTVNYNDCVPATEDVKTNGYSGSDGLRDQLPACYFEDCREGLVCIEYGCTWDPHWIEHCYSDGRLTWDPVTHMPQRCVLSCEEDCHQSQCLDYNGNTQAKYCGASASGGGGGHRRQLAGASADGTMLYGGFGRELDEIFVNMFTVCGGIFTMRQREFSTHMLLFFIVFALYMGLVLLRVLVGGTVAVCLHTFGQRGEFAAIRRGTTLVNCDTKRSVASRKATFDSFGFDQPLEFDEDDLGPAGGIQIDRLSTDPIMNHGRTIGDRIVRYSCKCDDDLPWPVAAVQHDLVEEALEKFEAMMDKFRRDFKVWHRLMLMKKADGTGQLQSLSISDQEEANIGSEGSDDN
jgi:hemoglobin-like flavoprotein